MNLSNDKCIVDGIVGHYSFALRHLNSSNIKEVQGILNEAYYPESKIKEFIKKIENIIVRRKSRREQLLELKKEAGSELI